MPQGEPYRSIDDLPPEFEEFSAEAKKAALDAYNGALAKGAPTREARKAALTIAQQVDGQAGQGPRQRDRAAGPPEREQGLSTPQGRPGPPAGRGPGGTPGGGRGGGGGRGPLAAALAG